MCYDEVKINKMKSRLKKKPFISFSLFLVSLHFGVNQPLQFAPSRYYYFHFQFTLIIVDWKRTTDCVIYTLTQDYFGDF